MASFETNGALDGRRRAATGANLHRAVRLLAVTGVLAVVAAPIAARAQDADPWFGRDKALHFSASASIAVLGYAGSMPISEDRRARASVGAGLALGAGVGKEIWDLSGHGDASARDLVWDVIGTATGVFVAWTVDWLIRRVIATS